MTTYKKNNFFENCSFVKGVANIEGLEISDVPEIAFFREIKCWKIHVIKCHNQKIEASTYI
jgi:hypothetical protein